VIQDIVDNIAGTNEKAGSRFGGLYTVLSYQTNNMQGCI
jgi:hypothetical protein